LTAGTAGRTPQRFWGDPRCRRGRHGAPWRHAPLPLRLDVAGTTEDKVEVVARVRWSGAGVGIRKQAVTPTGRPVLRDYDATATAGAGVLAGASS
jgi:hypothetical protein